MNIWKFGGNDLSAFGVLTMLDDYLDMPERRGDNQVIPYRHGSIFVPKYYAERTLTFGLAVSGVSAPQIDGIMDTLHALLAPKTQQILSRTLEDGTIRTVMASVDKSLQVNRPAPWVAKIAIEFVLPFPFFRLSTAIADNTTVINASPKAMTVTNPGNVEERDATFILTGPLTNVLITNSVNGQTLYYGAAIVAPRIVTISTSADGEYVATDDLGNNVIGNLTHAGSSTLMVFDIGANVLSIINSVTTTGTIKITFNAPYL